MKKFLLASLITTVLLTSCQIQRQDISDISQKPPAIPQPAATVSFTEKPTPEEKQDSEERQRLIAKKWDAEDEVETLNGKIKVWAKSIEDKRDELKIRNELYYQIAGKDPVLIIRTKWYEHFEAVKLSPNGKWMFAIRYVEGRVRWSQIVLHEYSLTLIPFTFPLSNFWLNFSSRSAAHFFS